MPKMKVYFNGQLIGEISEEMNVLSSRIGNTSVSISWNPLTKTIDFVVSMGHMDCQTSVLELEAEDGDYIGSVALDGYEAVGCGWYRRGWSIRVPKIDYSYSYQLRARDEEQVIFAKGRREIVGMLVGGTITGRIALRKYEPYWK